MQRGGRGGEEEQEDEDNEDVRIKKKCVSENDNNENMLPKLLH